MASVSHSLIAHNRFGYGLAPGETPAADPQAWLTRQIDAFDPAPPSLTRSAPSPLDVLKSIDPNAKKERRTFYDSHRERIWARAETARVSETPFMERLVHFWANHFAVSADKKIVTALASSFEFNAIRPHIAGSFEDLLISAETHPAMLIYLDQSRSIGPDSPLGKRRTGRGAKNRGLNENLAREILELHTMGARSDYTQADVEALAYALTGYTITGTQDASTRFVFEPTRHQPGGRRFLGREYGQSGQKQARTMLSDVVRQPATARYVATKLARHFISDTPPEASIARLSDAFARSGGDLPAVYRALISDPAAWNNPALKFKSPWDWTVSALRSAGIEIGKPERLAIMLDRLGQKIWEPQSPAGFPDIASHWLAPDALLRRADAALELAERSLAPVDARQVAEDTMLGELSDDTRGAIAAAGDPGQGFALYTMSPEFLWR